ncbi:MAG: DNA repair protein RecN [Varibaculum sp.]|nr:DNA repair protein RecN [Varibaculum sp.]
MITELDIAGSGVIDHATLDFMPGFTALTGETGAGKTLVINSVELLLGYRADPSLVRGGAEMLRVSGTFNPDPAIRKKVEELGGYLEDDGSLLVTRSVPYEGRSKATLGGIRVPSGVLAELSDRLVKIHGQSDQLLLRSPTRQREVLDEYAGNGELLNRVAKSFDEWQAAAQELSDWMEGTQQRAFEIAGLTDTLQRISDIDPQAGEDEKLAARIARLANVDSLRQAVAEAQHAVYGSGDFGADTTAQYLTGLAAKRLRQAAAKDPELLLLADQLDELQAVLSDIGSSLTGYLSGLDADPQQLETDQRRLAELRHLLSGLAPDVDALLVERDRMQQRLNELADPEDREETLREQLQIAQKRLRQDCQELKAARQRAATDFSKQVNLELEQLSMGAARFAVTISETAQYTRNGTENVTFQITGQGRPVSVSKAASGGELSRIMLAIELAGQAGVSHENGNESATLIFDEIDSGVGGAAASKIGQRLATLAKNRQIIVVTHLPQVAVFATRHYVVRKDADSAQVDLLDDDARVTEISRMLAGDSSSSTSRKHAAELLSRAQRGIMQE